jgi:C1A family cysteine protease
MKTVTVAAFLLLAGSALTHAVSLAELPSALVSKVRSRFSEWKTMSHTSKRAFAQNLVAECKWADLDPEEVAQNIEQHAAINAEGDNGHQNGINCMSAFSREQFKAKFLRAKVPAEARNRPSAETGSSRQKRQTVPASWDWRSQGYVTPVQNQGQCGSCWTFSAAGAMEGALYKKNKVLPNISEQNLVDCVLGYGSDGCNGGWMTDAYDYSSKNKGVDSESSYPYKALQGTCKYTTAGNVGNVTKYTYTKANDEADLKAKLYSVGPIAVAVDATYMQSYTAGVFQCTNYTDVNHGVLLVGYGTDTSLGDYYLIKNSWGTSWGESGYIRVKRNAGYAVACGIPSYANYPLTF